MDACTASCPAHSARDCTGAAGSAFAPWASPRGDLRPPGPALPTALAPRRLARRAAQVGALMAVLALVVALAPGFDEVAATLADAHPGWIALAVVLEALSCASFVLLIRPVFSRRLSRQLATRIGLSQLGVGALVPTSGAAGLALGAWALHRTGMTADHIARRSVALFVVKGSVNFVAVVVLGLALAAGLLGGDLPLWLTAGPAVLALLALAAVGLVAHAGADAGAGPTRRALAGGMRDAATLIRRGDGALLAGAIGYWAFDNAVLWATFQAFGASVPIETILMGYLIGQLGGLVPVPGGVGAIDGGLIGALVVFGAPAVPAAAAVLAYRAILFWLPLAAGAVAFAGLRRELAET